MIKFIRTNKLICIWLLSLVLIFGSGTFYLVSNGSTDKSNSENSLKDIPVLSEKIEIVPLVKRVPSEKVIKELNNLRSIKNAPQLTTNSQLMLAAKNRAEDMVKKNYNDIETVDPWSFVSAAGYKYGSVRTSSYRFGPTNELKDLIQQLKSKNWSEFTYDTAATEIGVGIFNQPQDDTSGILVFFLASPAIQPNVYTPPVADNYTPPDTSSYDYSLPDYETTPDRCDTSSERSELLNEYNSDLSFENSDYSRRLGEINRAISQISNANAGNSSAMQQVLRMKASLISQHQSNLTSLRTNYDASISSLPC